MAETLGAILQILVIGGFLLFGYTKIKGQTMRETFEEIRELIRGLTNKYG